MTKSNLELAIKNVSIINVEEYHLELDKRRLLAKELLLKEKEKGEDDIFDDVIIEDVKYDLLLEKVVKYKLQNAKEFVDCCNVLISKRDFALYDNLRFSKIDKLYIRDTNRGWIIEADAFTPLTHPRNDAYFNKFGFFKLKGSNQIDGFCFTSVNSIYDINKKDSKKAGHVLLTSYIMPQELEKILL